MPVEQFGEAAPRNFTREVACHAGRVPCAGWEISAETIQELEKLEKAVMPNDLRSGMFLLD